MEGGTKKSESKEKKTPVQNWTDSLKPQHYISNFIQQHKLLHYRRLTMLQKQVGKEFFLVVQPEWVSNCRQSVNFVPSPNNWLNTWIFYYFSVVGLFWCKLLSVNWPGTTEITSGLKTNSLWCLAPAHYSASDAESDTDSDSCDRFKWLDKPEANVDGVEHCQFNVGKLNIDVGSSFFLDFLSDQSGDNGQFCSPR